MEQTRVEEAIYEIKRVIVGQDALIERLMVGMISGGHILLEGVPGVAKTLACQTLATVVGGSFSRIQFTPDLVPSDIVGTRIYKAGTETFDIEYGPVIANIVLADEINRAPAKVQSALLEVMAEGQVSIGGTTTRMPQPFIVLATQNPIENEGVYPLPEAQRDRFLFQVAVDYPTVDEEREIIYRMGQVPPTPRALLSEEDILALREQAQNVFVHHALVDYVVRLIHATREPQELGLGDVARWLSYGASPRASLGLISGARALALIRGRDFVVPQDIIDLVPDVLRHRLVLSYEAYADEVDRDAIIRQILAHVGVPAVGVAAEQAQPEPAQIPAVGAAPLPIQSDVPPVPTRTAAPEQPQHQPQQPPRQDPPANPYPLQGN